MSLKEQILAQFEDETTLGFNEIRKDSQYLALFAEEPRWLHTVELFCFGEYSDYNTTDYIELTPAALFKLRKLTMASECLKQNTLTYTHLQEKLQIKSVTTLEMFLAESIFSHVVDAVVFSEEQLVRVKSSAGRDVLLPGESIGKYTTNSTQDLITGLHEFQERIAKGINYVGQISKDLGEPLEEDASSSRKRKIKS